MANLYSINLVVIVGNLVRIDKEETMKNLGSRKYLRFTVATNELFPNRKTHEPTRHTEFHVFTAYGRRADVISRYAKPGQLLAIIGKNRSKTFEDDEGFRRKYSFIEVGEVMFLSKPKTDIKEVPDEESEDPF